MSQQLLQCPTSHDLARFSAGLDPNCSVEEIAGHLDSCTRCQATIERLGDNALAAALKPPASAFAFRVERGFQQVAERLSQLSQAGASAESHSCAELPEQIGRYRIERVIGKGGFGLVYLAHDEQLDRRVAIKIPHARWVAGRTDANSYLLREARAAAQLKHRHIVPVHEVGKDSDERVYIVSDFVEGATLHHWLDGQRLTVRESVELCATLAEALHYAHEQGVVHRDIKPANIMMDRDGEPHIMDFGLAKRDAGEVTMTADGAIMGTPAYMSPEQAAGRGHDADRGSDVYSLGVIFYELLTGERPFRGATRMLIEQILEQEPPAPRSLNNQIPKDAETICLKCLEKSPEQRYANSRELEKDLNRYLNGEAIHARPISRLQRGWRWSRRHPAAALVLTLLLVLVTGSTAAAVAIASAVNSRNTAERNRTYEQVNALLTAEPAEVPNILASLAPFQEMVTPRLSQMLQTELPPEQRWRVSLALLPVDTGQLNWLFEFSLSAGPEQLIVVRDAMYEHRGALLARLWTILLDEEDELQRRFNAAVELALYDPADPRSKPANWGEPCRFAARELIDRILESRSNYRLFMDAFRPIGSILAEPLSVAFRDESLNAAQRFMAATLLLDYAGDQPGVIAAMIQDADLEQFELLCSKLESDGTRIPYLKEILQQEPAADVGFDDKLALDRQQANVAVALLRIGEGETVWPLLRNSRDPTRRTYIVDGIVKHGVDSQLIWERLQTEPDVSVRRALLLALGEMDGRQLGAQQREPFIPRLVELYRDDPDSGIRGAAEWVLRQWAQEDQLNAIDQALAGAPAEAGRNWYVNGQGQTMVLVPDGSSVFVRLDNPAMFQYRKRTEIAAGFGPIDRIGHSFWIASKEVSVAQYRRFRKLHIFLRKIVPDDTGAAHRVKWFQAAAYCNWLSEQEGIPEEEWCFVPNEDGKYDEGMRLSEDYLSRTGYRLPTHAEWDYACRAGAQSEYYFGNDHLIAHKYSWYTANSLERIWPGGSLRPNDFGLFDMHGNVYEWLANTIRDDRPTLAHTFAEGEDRMMAGGSYSTNWPYQRAPQRTQTVPSSELAEDGFRVVRTYRP